MTVGERIKHRRIELGLSVDELSELLGKNRATIYRYESNEIEKLPTPVLEPLSKALQCSPAYLMGWSESKEDTSCEILKDNNIRKIPLFESISAGFGAYADSKVIGYEAVYIESDYDAAETIAIKVKGDSMYPKIEDGDIIIVRKELDYKNGDIVAVIIGDEGFVKRIKVSDDMLILESINPEYQNKIFKGKDMNCVKVVGTVKKIIKSV
jgi:repressor LexA